MRKILCKYVVCVYVCVFDDKIYATVWLKHAHSWTHLFFVHLFRRLKKISQVETAIGREQRKNDALDRKIANLKVQIDNENFNNDFLIHEEDIIRRNER